MEGRIVHTNEFMCSLGKEYYVWKSFKGVRILVPYDACRHKSFWSDENRILNRR